VSAGGRPEPAAVQNVAVIGTGVIGAGWAAHFLRMGYGVAAWDPGPGAAERLAAFVEGVWPALERLGLHPAASPRRLRLAGSLSEAVADADFVQESAPEILDVKTALLAEIDAVTPPDVVIGSSTSGFMMTDMAARAKTPGRFVVGHPFNPPYLIPLVEIVGGRDTDPVAVTWAEKFYTLAGKVCLTMDREVPGFVGNRLQEALWREALHMINSGQATVQQIDDSITYGPGLRWALMGPMLTFHLAGGQGGMAHMLDHFGPALLQPWTRLTAPELTPRLRDLVVTGVDEFVGDVTVRQLEQQRDDFLADLLLLIEKHRRALLS
jgi:carnitine 3-dehydrogenase